MPQSLAKQQQQPEWQKYCSKTHDGHWMFVGPGASLHISVWQSGQRTPYYGLGTMIDVERTPYYGLGTMIDFEVPLYHVFTLTPEAKIIRESTLMERMIAEQVYGAAE